MRGWGERGSANGKPAVGSTYTTGGAMFDKVVTVFGWASTDIRPQSERHPRQTDRLPSITNYDTYCMNDRVARNPTTPVV